MNKIVITLSILIFIYIGGCSKGSSERINLEQGIHLENTTSGSFLKALNINYENDNSFFVELRKSLRETAILEDEYYEDGDKIFVKRWRVNGLYFGNPIIILEKLNSGYMYFGYHLGAEGKQYSLLIGDQSESLGNNRNIEHSVTISSQADNARLLLFGYGKYCSYMVILEGA